VKLQEPKRRGQVLARIGALLEPPFQGNSKPQAWRLEGFYNIQREER
jgi:hypothetical protein